MGLSRRIIEYFKVKGKIGIKRTKTNTYIIDEDLKKEYDKKDIQINELELKREYREYRSYINFMSHVEAKEILNYLSWGENQ